MFERKIAYPAYGHYARKRALGSESIAAIEATIALAPAIDAAATETERSGRLSPEILEKMGAIGIWTMGAPNEVGGGKFDYPVQFRVIEELARADGTAGWNVLTHLAGSALSMRLTEPAAKGIWKSPVTIVSGTPAPSGRALKVDGGYLIFDGKWDWSTNGKHATHYLGGFQIVKDRDDPGIQFPPPDGKPLAGQFTMPMACYFDRDQVEYVEGSWDVLGLRGTSSGSYRVKEQFVPEARCFTMFGGKSPLTMKGPIGIGGHAAVTLGIARHALELFYDLANKKRPTGFGQRDLLADMPVVQHEIAMAEAKLRSARSLFYEVIDDCWARWADGEPVTAADYLASEMSNVHAARTAREVVDTVFSWGGGSVLMSGRPAERTLRDMMTAGAHMAIQLTNWATYGKALMGRPVLMMNAFDAGNISPNKEAREAAVGANAVPNGAHQPMTPLNPGEGPMAIPDVSVVRTFGATRGVD